MLITDRPDEIDTEACLPPTVIETVILPFEPMQRLSYNFLAALVVANVYACKSLTSNICCLVLMI